jgi:dUTP pyrophosphatase
MSELVNDNHEEENFDDLINMLESLNDDDANMDALLDLLGISADELDSEFQNQSMRLELKFKKTNPNSTSPQYAYPTDSGFDLYSTEEITIKAFDRMLVPTGIHIDIPDGYEIQVRSKSGLALKEGLMVLNSPGTVDQGYTGEIQVIEKTDIENKDRNDKGFGSTGL